MHELTETQRTICIHRMHGWFAECQEWARKFEQSMPTTEEAIKAHNAGEPPPRISRLYFEATYFIVAAGCTYYVAAELVRDREKSKSKSDKWLEQFRHDHQPLESLRDRRDVLTHGVLTRLPDYDFGFRAFTGPDKTPAEALEEAKKYGKGSVGFAHRCEWQDDRSVDDVKQWHRDVLGALQELIATLTP